MQPMIYGRMSWKHTGVKENKGFKRQGRKFLNVFQAGARELIKTTHFGKTLTLVLVGMPNVGKSALANSLHQIGRINATGAFMDSIVGKTELAYYFLAILNWSKEYTKWAKLPAIEKDGSSTHLERDENSHFNRRQKKRFATDYTQCKELSQKQTGLERVQLTCKMSIDYMHT